jgi:endonuclease-3 related protein
MKQSQQNILVMIFRNLLKTYGRRNWWPAKTRFEVIAGAILTQNVSWRNAKTAVNNLKKAGLLSSKAIISASHEEIAQQIKSSRFYNQKTNKLKNFSRYLEDRYNSSLDKMFSHDAEALRNELLNIKGIGKETADSILLYAGKKLSFVSDAYTKRFLERYGLLNGMSSYDEIRSFFMKNLPSDLYLYNEYHALIVHHGYAVCKSLPICNDCNLRKLKDNIFCNYLKANN